MLYRLSRSLCAIAFVAFSCSPALSWGGKGHHIVGAVADIILEQHKAAQNKIKEILGGNSLAAVAFWADCAKGFNYCHRKPSAEEKAYTDKNKDNHSFHYTDVPFQEKAYKDNTAGTAKDDIVHVMEDAIAVLRGNPPADAPAKLTQREALWLLTHLIGDIHQPLHVAALYYDEDCQKVVDPNIVAAGKPNFGINKSISSTTGGNDLIIGSNNLHHYWDTTIVDRVMKAEVGKNGSIEDYAQVLVDHPPTKWKTGGDVTTWPEKWATEIMPLGKAAYNRVRLGNAEHPDEAHPKGLKCTASVALESGYDTWANKKVTEQLRKAGFRLAALLEAIFEPH